MGLPTSRQIRRSLSRLAARTPREVRAVLRPVARRVGLAAAPGDWAHAAVPPWAAVPGASSDAVWCNICRWSGRSFLGEAHTESAACPRCGSIARDRFLFWCFLSRHPGPAGLRVLETSPRLGDDYRTFMRSWFDYRASDFDLSAHAGDIRIDLQAIDLPDASLDVVLTPHVLEHVPDTARALGELHRVIAAGGRMYLQVPLVVGDTRVPSEPEFHADNTPVFFNFGWDLTDQLRAAGFDADVLVTEQYFDWLTGRSPAPASNGDGFVVESLVEHARPNDLIAVAGPAQSSRLGFVPAYHFATWECRRM